MSDETAGDAAANAKAEAESGGLGPASPHRLLVVGDRGAGRRVDTYLALRFGDWSRAQFVRWIRQGLVRSDTRALKPSTTLNEGEVVRIYVPGIAPDGPPPPMPTVLFEDEHLMAVDKPAGLLMHAVGQRWSYSVVGIVRDARPGFDVDIAHRLDRETSGVVMLVKSLEANRRMRDLFMDRFVSKTYLAIVRGEPPWEARTCAVPLGTLNPKAMSEVLPGKPETVELRQGYVPGGAHAVTHIEVVQRTPGYTLVRCAPETGRTHQIRAHLEAEGFPILGDKLYGQPDDVFLESLRKGATVRVRAAIGFPRHCLHASALRFPHPFTGQTLSVASRLPVDMQAVLDGTEPTWVESVEAAGQTGG